MVAVQVISTLVSPVYGDFYSFPWKRGPHDNILEYTEASATFESVRESIFNQLKEFDFTVTSIPKAYAALCLPGLILSNAVCPLI